MKLWLIVTGVACLTNLLALNTIGKNYKSNGLLRGTTFGGIFAFWGILSTIWLYHQDHWLYYACNILSATLTGATVSFTILAMIRSKKEKISTHNELDQPQRKVS
jgi:hypothetical protein